MKKSLLLIIVFLVTVVGSNAQQWWSTGGPAGGDVRAIAIAPDGTVYAGTQGGGIFISENNGTSWYQFNDGLTNLDVRGIVINTNGIVFIATMGGGVFKLDDVWTPMNNGLDYLWLNTIAINADGDLFVGTYEGGGIYRSTDNGNSWIQINTGLTTTYINAIAVGNNGVIYAGGYMGIFKSTDNGNTWVQKDNGIGEAFVLSLAVNSEGVVFAGLDFSMGMYRSVDDGESWVAISNGMGYPPGINALLVISNNMLLAGTYGMGIFKTSNNGDEWQAVNQGLDTDYIVSLAADTDDDLYAGAYLGGGLYLSSDLGNQWIPAVNGLSATSVRALTHDLNGTYYSATYGNGIFKYDVIMETWNRVTSTTDAAYFNDIYCSNTGDLYATADFVNGLGGLYKSSDLGVTWTELLNGISEYEVRGVVVNSQNQIFVATYGDGVLRSSDNGITWQQVNTGLDCTYLWSITIAEDEVADDILYAGSAGCNTGVYRSTDNAESWTLINNGLLTTDIKCIAYSDAFRPLGCLMAGTHPIFGEGGGVYYSFDLGDTWQEFNDELGNLYINDIAFTSYGRVFIATNDGVYESWGPPMVPWYFMSDGLTNRHINGLSFDGGTFLYAGTAGSGAWKGWVEVGRKEDVYNNTLHIYLNPVTDHVRYTNNYTEGVATLKIYDQNGRQVISSYSIKGENIIPVHLLAEGVYYLKLQSGNKSQSVKFIKR